MTKKQWILIYLSLGILVALIRRQWGGGSVYPLVSAFTAQDILIWPYSAFTMANLYRETGFISGGQVRMGPPSKPSTAPNPQSMGTLGA